MILDSTRAYLAGLIDGEGHIGINRTSTNAPAKGCKRGLAYRLTVSVKMTDRRPLDFAHRETALGQIRPVKREARFRPTWEWATWSREAATLIAMVRPFLLVKSEAADLALEFQAAMRMPGRLGLTDAEWELRERLYRRIKETNYGPSSRHFS